MPPVNADSIQPGDRLADKYRIVREIAGGGMGVVYEAENERLGQRVAVKVMRSAMLEDLEAVARFEREAQAAGKLQSEHVARVFDVDTLEDGTPFMVMEFLDGVALETLIAMGAPMLVEEAVDYALQCLIGLAEAHAMGIIHRDLKPSNLISVGRAQGDQVLKILDFGISKMTSGDVGDTKNLTASQVILGTPAYMAPEQVVDSRDVDGRADLWSLGAILYEMVTGTCPFEAESAGAVFAKILQMPIESPRELNARVPVGLNKVILRCLERDRADRYTDAGELFDALQPFTGEERVKHPQTRSSLPAPSGIAVANTSKITALTWGRRAKRDTAQRVMLLALLLPLLGGLALGGWFLLRAPAARQAAASAAPTDANSAPPVPSPTVDASATAPAPRETAQPSASATTPPAPKPSTQAVAPPVTPKASAAPVDTTDLDLDSRQ